MVMLRDGKVLIGYLRTMDQFANLVLHETIERIYVDKYFGNIPRGIFLIRGENVILAGEIDEKRPCNLTEVVFFCNIFNQLNYSKYFFCIFLIAK